MESWLIIFLITIGYLLASLIVGVMSGRKASDSTEGYVAGDRSLGFLVLYFVLGASIFSAFAFLGAPGWAYSRGAAVFYILSYGTVGLLPWYFFGPRVAALGRRFGYVTQAQLFAHRFESRTLSATLAVISLIAFIPYLVLQMQGAGYVFNVVTEGRLPEWAGAAIAYGVVLVYVFYSGVMGVGWTNTFQGIFMMVLAWTLGLYLPYKLYGGVGAMFASPLKPARSPSGPASLRAFVERYPDTPHLAIGGITPDNVDQVAEAGGRGVAVSTAVCAAADPAAVVGTLVARLSAASTGRPAPPPPGSPAAPARTAGR